MNLRGMLYKLLLVVCFGAGLFTSDCADVQAGPSLSNDDCILCHRPEINSIAAEGGMHRDAVTCIDCHREHPPRGGGAIPACSLCHDPENKTHFKVQGCTGCHPAHTPQKIAFAGTARLSPACSTCHQKEPEELAKYPSNHSVLDCKYCHQGHGVYLSCLECHAPHLENQDYLNCRQCHPPHSPLKVVYANTLPSENCAVCHPEPAQRLSESETKHSLLLCVYCHKSQHKQIPECETCHFRPHTPGMHDKYPDCESCHGGPHNLIN